MPTRPYRSARRSAAAAATRAAVLDAALRLFEQRSYAGTAIADVAAAADVAVTTVYSSVGGKPQLLVALIQDAAGDPAIGAAMTAVAEAGSGAEVLAGLAAGTRAVFEQHAWVLGTLYDNAAADPVILAAQQESEHAYRRRVHAAAQRLGEVSDPALDPGACADVLWFFFGFRAWRDLRSLDWSWDRAEAWLVGQAAAALLGTDPPRAGAGHG